MKTEKNILLKAIPFILAIILPSIDYLNSNTNGNTTDALFRWVLISFTLLAIWYLNLFISKYKPLSIVIINLLFIGFLSLITIILSLKLPGTTLFPRILLPTILFIAIQQTIQSIQDKRTLITENLTLKSETYKAELQNLRNQINPHFLFNSLTTLQTLIRQNPILAEDYLIRLSDFYRTTLLSSNHNKTTLKEEIAFIEAYIFLLKNRFENGLIITIETNKNALKHELPIFALQLLIENCIKHNIISDEKPLEIIIFQNDESSITVKNNMQPKLKKEPSTQTGLANLAKRYALLGIQNGVEVQEKETQFSVTLKLF